MRTLARRLYMVKRKVDGAKRSDKFYWGAGARDTPTSELVEASRTSPMLLIAKGLGTNPPPQ